MIPEDEKMEGASFISNALYYFGAYDLQHKLILLEDMDGTEIVMSALRELISKNHIIELVPLKAGPGYSSEGKSGFSVLFVGNYLAFR